LWCEGFLGVFLLALVKASLAPALALGGARSDACTHTRVGDARKELGILLTVIIRLSGMRILMGTFSDTSTSESRLRFRRRDLVINRFEYVIDHIAPATCPQLGFVPVCRGSIQETSLWSSPNFCIPEFCARSAGCEFSRLLLRSSA
jgi:hypothetical protein